MSEKPEHQTTKKIFMNFFKHKLSKLIYIPFRPLLRPPSAIKFESSKFASQQKRTFLRCTNV